METLAENVPMDSGNDSKPGNIFLVGLMGSGKTSVGKVLARMLDKVFVDSDHEIERATGVRIPVIFEIEGESKFRERERKMIAELVARDNVVLATGGGAILAAENREALKTKVKVGAIDNGTATIVSGLETAKALIITGSAYLKEGSAIKITQ